MKNSLFKRNKNFTISFLGQLVSSIGNLLYSFAVSFYILKISNNNPIIQGLYLAICGITFCLMSPLGGVIADRFNKAKIMYVCDYLKGGLLLISTILIMLIFTTNESQVVMLFIIGFMGNFIAAIFSPASSGITRLIVDDNDLQKANSYYSLLNSFQNIIGVLLAGIMYSLFDIYTLFIIVSICFILSGVSEMFIKYDTIEENNGLSIKNILFDIRDGFTYLLNNKALFAIMMTCLFLNFFFSPVFDNFIPFHISNDISESDYIFKDLIESPEMFSGLFTVLFGIGSLISGIYLSKKEFNKVHKVVSLSLLGCSFSILAYSFVFSLSESLDNINISIIGIFVMMFIVGILLIGVNVPSSTVMAKLTDENMLGKVNGTLNIGTQGLVPLATFLAGLIINYLGEFTLLIICGIGFLAITITYIFNKNVKDI